MKTILVIDDERPTLTTFGLFLKAYGYSVLVATDGEEGLELFRRERPRIVFTDFKLPRMDGIEVLQQIKAIEPRTEVIVITGHGDMDLALKSLNLDATDFINKPIQRKALEQALDRAERRLRLSGTKAEEIQAVSDGTAAVIRIKGVFNAASEPFMETAYDSAASPSKERLVISLDENAAVNGAGLAILGQILMKARKDGLAPALVTPSKKLRSTFELAGLSGLAPVFTSESDAGMGSPSPSTNGTDR
ncbi:MAG: response regulator [Desulfobacterales bacterium]